MKGITIFCGSSLGSESEFEKQAYELGAELAHRGITTIYGGAKIGLMGAVANGALDNSGKVIGIIPNFLSKKEVVHQSLTELITVETMHQRKHEMSELADGFIALPGGFGTLEELFEVLTWAQLNRHQKPIGILNTNGYYDELLSFIKKTNAKGFLRGVNIQLLLVSTSIHDLLEQINNYTPPKLPRWS